MRRCPRRAKVVGMDAMGREGLIRPRHGRVLAGVCAGLARRLGLGPLVTRVLFLVANTVIPGSFLIVYVVLWVLMPAESDRWVAPPARA